MTPLPNYLYNDKDCHVHLFDADGCVLPCRPMGVGFAFVSSRVNPEKYTKENVKEMYGRYINQYPGYTILATGLDPETAIEIQQEYSLPGFGELRCQGQLKSHEYWRELFDYAESYHMPIWIHWSLCNVDDFNELCHIVRSYPHVNFVICHCGIPSEDEGPQVSKLQSLKWCMEILRLPNAFTDVSWTGSDFLLRYRGYKLPEGKFIIGSDITPHDTDNKQRLDFEEISKLLRTDNKSILMRIFK